MKSMKDLYTENHKTVLKVIKEDSGKAPCVHEGFGRLKVVRMPILPKAASWFDITLIKTPIAFL
jgi:hypothetical protein